MDPILLLAIAILGWLAFFVMSVFAFTALKGMRTANKLIEEALALQRTSDRNWQEIVQDILEEDFDDCGNEGEEWKEPESPTHGEN